jgi:hypothetical protein
MNASIAEPVGFTPLRSRPASGVRQFSMSKPLILQPREEGLTSMWVPADLLIEIVVIFALGGAALLVLIVALCRGVIQARRRNRESSDDPVEPRL